MKSFRHECAVAALLSACLAGTAQAQVHPYPLANNYPTTAQTPSSSQYVPAYPASFTGNQGFAQSGPVLTPAMANTPQGTGALTPVGGPPAQAPPAQAPPAHAHGGAQHYDQDIVTPLGDYGAGYSGEFGGYGASCSGEFGADYGYGLPPAAGRAGWFGSVAGLVMTRDRGNHYFFSYERTNEANQLTDSRRAEIEWGGGLDARFGHYFNCGQNAVQAVYWGLFPETATTDQTTDSITQLDAILNFSALDYNG